MATGITLVQALLIGLAYSALRITQLGGTFAGPFFFSPLPMALIVGIVLGDVPQAMVIGAHLQLIYLGMVSPGGSAPSDVCIASMIGVSMAIAGGLDQDVAVLMAVPAGVLGRQLNVLIYTINVMCSHLADKHAAEGDDKGVFVAGAILPQIAKFVATIPLTIIVYVGPALAEAIMNNVPQWVMSGFATAGKLMPALGFALLLNSIGKANLMPFFFIGFLAIKYLGVPIIPVAIVAAFMAYFWLVFTSGEDSLKGFRFDTSEADEREHVLDMKDIRKVYFRWWLFAEATHNYERMLGHSFCLSMIPAINKLYGDNKDEKAAALTRHMQFYNCEVVFGSIIPGVIAAMEEQRAMGAEEITDTTITGIKTGLMGPMAGIGDTLNVGTFLPIVISLFLPLAESGSALGALGPFCVYAITGFVVGWFLCKFGYQLGSRAALQLMRSGLFNQIITAASVLGLVVIGALCSNYVSITTPLVIETISTTYAIQDVLDGILKGALTLIAIFGTRMFINKVNRNYVVAIGMLFAIGFICGALGILG